MAKQRPQINDAIVSDESERLILVDEHDKPCGYASKAECHDGDGLLHRAFSLFVLDGKGHVLMQQRSSEKRLWPMYWPNSCCSHPREGETMETATQRRLEEELGISCNFKYLFKFRYQEEYGDEGSEHEYCWVYLGRSDDPVRCNRNEIASWCFIEPTTLERLLYEHPQWFTPWFRMEWRQIMTHHHEEFEALTDVPRWQTAESARVSG